MAAGVVFEETSSYYGLKNKIAIFSHEYSFEQIFKKKKKRGGAWWISCFHQSSAVLGPWDLLDRKILRGSWVYTLFSLRYTTNNTVV